MLKICCCTDYILFLSFCIPHHQWAQPSFFNRDYVKFSQTPNSIAYFRFKDAVSGASWKMDCCGCQTEPIA